MSLRLLAVTGGHRVDLDAFLGMVQVICREQGWQWGHAVQPGAQQWFTPGLATAWDAVLLHDIPGLRLQRGVPPEPFGPDVDTADAIAGWLEAGVGVVATHHALAGWPSWDGWATALGGRFLYAPGSYGGVARPSSGTRIDRYRISPVDPGHPVCAGVEPFELTDERYICPVFESSVVPLLRTDATVDGGDFISTYEHVLHGEAAAPSSAGHADASSLAAWATAAGRSPVVYLQPGDSAVTFGLAPYRRLVANAVAWVASPGAREWATERTGGRRIDRSVSAHGTEGTWTTTT